MPHPHGEAPSASYRSARRDDMLDAFVAEVQIQPPTLGHPLGRRVGTDQRFILVACWRPKPPTPGSDASLLAFLQVTFQLPAPSSICLVPPQKLLRVVDRRLAPMHRRGSARTGGSSDPPDRRTRGRTSSRTRSEASRTPSARASRRRHRGPSSSRARGRCASSGGTAAHRCGGRASIQLLQDSRLPPVRRSPGRARPLAGAARKRGRRSFEGLRTALAHGTARAALT